MIHILKKDPRYPTCNIEEKAETIDELNKYKFKIECYYSFDRPTEKKVDNVFCVGDTYEECLERYFKKNLSWTYCNDSNIMFCKEEDRLAYRNFFFGENGKSNYARMGGDMY